MQRGTARRRIRAIALTGVIILLAAGAAAPGGAHHLAPGPRVDIQSAAWLAPDGQSMTVQVLASCPERWTVVEATVKVSQSQASGQASFPLTCIGSWRMFTVAVPAAGGTFGLDEPTQAAASVVIKRGRTDRAQDSETLFVQPAVFVDIAQTAQLENSGNALTLALSVACPVGANGRESRIGVSQGETRGVGFYVPECDGSEHAFIVRIEATRGLYQPGVADALTFADVEHNGFDFTGVDEQRVEIAA
jgi:hypothetical protein